jgi:hypothetical protein
MHIETLYATRRSGLIRLVATALLLTLAACSQLSDTRKPAPDKNAPRAQLSIGYSLLYQEADGIPKLKWIFLFKDKPEEMGRVTNDLVSYYQQLADTMQKLSKQFPGMRIEVTAMSVYNTLNEQRHLTGVMVDLEPDPTLKKFLETTKAQLEGRYAKVGALLNRRYFTQ